jgi:hypothetical protein
MLPATITSGDAEHSNGGWYFVPKRDLIIGLQILLQCGDLQIANRLAHGPALVKEMADMQVKVTPSGHEKYGAWREGQHDDLVFAVSLACWGAKKMYPRPPSGDDRFRRMTAERPDLKRALGGMLGSSDPMPGFRF